MRYASHKDERSPYRAPEMVGPSELQARANEVGGQRPLTSAALLLAAAILIGFGIGFLTYEFQGRVALPAKVDVASQFIGEAGE